MINDRDLNKSIGKARDLWLDSLDLPEGKEAPFSPEFEKNTLRLLKRSAACGSGALQGIRRGRCTSAVRALIFLYRRGLPGGQGEFMP